MIYRTCRSNMVYMWTFFSFWTFLQHFQIIDGTCSFPATTWDGTWYDSSMTSDVTLDYANSKITSGWTVNAYSSTVSAWTCVTEDTTNNYLLFKGDTTVDLYGVPQNAFRCIKYTKVTDSSYIYYIYANVEVNAFGQRVLIEPYDAAVTSWSISGYCTPSNGNPSTEEYVTLVEAANVTVAKQWCPTPFLGTFLYTHNDGSSSTCGTGSVWDVCTIRNTMTVNYTQCSTTQYYSTDGVAYCVYSVQSGSTYFTTVLNIDSSVDYTSTFRFTCFAVTSSGSYVYASDRKGSCAAGQSPTVKESDGSGTIVYSAYITCPFTTDSDTDADSSSSNLVVIIAAVVAVLLIIILILIGIILCKKYKKKQKTGDSSREEKRKPPDDMTLDPVTPRDALTVNLTEPNSHLDPLPNKPAVPGDRTVAAPLPPISHH